MKLNLVILAVLATLVSAAPASASTINLILSSSSPVLGTPISYQVSGEAEVGQMYEVRIMQIDSSHPESECVRATPYSQLLRELEVQGKGSPLKSFNREETIPIKGYSELGTYAVCALVRDGSRNPYSESFAESTTSFTVVAPPAPPAPAPIASAPAPVPAPIVTPPPPVAPATSVVKPMSKLAKALKLCKKLKKHSKRVACEKLAEKRYGTKPKRH